MLVVSILFGLQILLYLQVYCLAVSHVFVLLSCSICIILRFPLANACSYGVFFWIMSRRCISISLCFKSSSTMTSFKVITAQCNKVRPRLSCLLITSADQSLLLISSDKIRFEFFSTATRCPMQRYW